jgi:hypothetical protein
MLRLGALVYLKVERLLFERPMLTSQVMTSFVVVAFFTIFLAFFPAFEEFKDWLISLRRSEDARSEDESHRFALSRTRIFMSPFPLNSKARNQPTSPEQNLEEQTHGEDLNACHSGSNKSEINCNIIRTRNGSTFPQLRKTFLPPCVQSATSKSLPV